jgi:metallo-beta-lactamase class B
MERALFGRLIPFLLLLGCAPSLPDSRAPITSTDTHSSDIVRFSAECEPWDDWDKPAKPFQIYANTYYVGTCGISSILIVGEDEHVLLDSGTEAGADVILKNIQSLGYDPADIEFIGTSHEHFDHVGGMAKLTQRTGALVATSEDGYGAILLGRASYADPQRGMHDPMQPVENVGYWDADAFEFARFERKMIAIATPGHTPGALSWQWESCTEFDCKTIVYADSLSPISRDDYRFSDHPEYLAEYRAGIARLRELECDILLTPHPSHSKMIERARTGTFEGGMTCAEYADSKTKALDKRLAKEAASE